MDTQTAPPVAPPLAPPMPQAGAGQPNAVGVSPMRRVGSYFLEMVLIIVTLGIGWVIWACVTVGNGQTPAKKLLGMRVVDAETQQPAGFGKMFFMRGLVGGFVAQFAIMFTLGIMLFMPFWDKKNQNLWDKVSGTLVIAA